MKLKELLKKFKTDLQLEYNEEEIETMFLITLDHFLSLRKVDYLLKKDEEIAADTFLKFELVLKELLDKKPIQYILGETYFYGLKFKVNPSVLIPRPETEELVEWVISVCKAKNLMIDRSSKNLNILDIGTGSGCIAISLKKNLSNANVYALDIAVDTLETAKQNAVLNDVVLEFIQDDILDTRISNLTSQISIIVSNPPYIKEDERLAMNDNVLANEPHRALFVSNEKPLVFYEAIAEFALKNLEDKGLLFFEINEYLGEQTVSLLKDKGFLNVELKKDMQGKDRMICCSKS